MIVFATSEAAKAALEKQAKQVQGIIDTFEGEEVALKHGVAKFFSSTGIQWQSFVRMAQEFGMLLSAGNRKKLSGLSIFMKTNSFPTFQIKQKPVKAIASIEAPKLPAKRKATGGTKKQGDGSAMKPRFNHAITKSVEPSHLAPRDRSGKGKLSLMGQIEDLAGYDVQSKLERLRELRSN